RAPAGGPASKSGICDRQRRRFRSGTDVPGVPTASLHAGESLPGLRRGGVLGASMMRTLRTVGAVFVFVSGIGLVRAGLWFLEEAGRAEKVAGELAAEGAPPIIPESLYARA